MTKTIKTAKTVKTVKTARKAAPHTAIMGAVTKSLSDGRMKDFMTNPSEATRDAIVAKVQENLTLLMKGKKVKTAAKVEKTEKVSKVAKVEKTEKTGKVAKAARLAKKIKANVDADKIERLILKKANAAHAEVLKVKAKTDDATKIKNSVSRILKKNGLDVMSVRSTGTAKVERSGMTFAIKFSKTAPTVSYVGAA